jgi:hypothetical protein
VLGLELDGLAVNLRRASVRRRLVPVRPCGLRIADGISLLFGRVLMLTRARLALPRALLSGPRFRNQFWVGHTCKVPTVGTRNQCAPDDRTR